jgi:tetratricopeptide (TPR) repeat protein
MSNLGLFRSIIARKPTYVIQAGGRGLCLTFFILIFISLMGAGCANKPAADLNEGISLYRQNKLAEALPYFDKAIEKDRSNSEALAWQAETYRRLGQPEKAMAAANMALAIDTCNSFAHVTLAYLYNPMYGNWKESDRETSWAHILKAADCHPEDGNVWLAVWTEAIYRGDLALEKKALQSLISTDFFAPAILAYNRWMLRYLPENAILITNGDMDTYPAAAIQEVENFRPDIVIANMSLLNTSWYPRFLKETYNVKLPFPDNRLDSLEAYKDEDGTLVTPAMQILQGWLDLRQKGELDNPIALAITVNEKNFSEDLQNHLILDGAYRLWLPQPAQSPLDTAMIRASLADLNPDDFAGSFVSDQDRSPVRIVSTDKLATNIADLALTCADEYIKAGHKDEAQQMIDWAETFENKIAAGPVFADRISKLREALQ